MSDCTILWNNTGYGSLLNIYGEDYETCLLALFKYLERFNYKVEGLSRCAIESSKFRYVLTEYHFPKDTSFAALRDNRIELENNRTLENDPISVHTVDFTPEFIKEWCKRYTIEYDGSTYFDHFRDGNIESRRIYAIKEGSYKALYISAPLEFKFNKDKFDEDVGLLHLGRSKCAIQVEMNSNIW